MDNNINQNIDEMEIDEATLELLEKSYKRKLTLSVITIIIALAAIVFSVFVFAGNMEITSVVSDAETAFVEENYDASIEKYKSAKETAEKYNSVIPVFKSGNKAFWGEIEAYEKLHGPVECIKLLDKYYPDGKYPAQAIPFLENAQVFIKAYNELNNIVNTEATAFSQAYEALKEIKETKPEYPEYLVLYFNLVATQKFEESPSTQLSAYEALKKKAPHATWLYEYEGTRALIAAGDLNAALRLCPEDGSEESKVLRVRIYRMLKEYSEAVMLYDEYRDFDIPSEELDRQRIILYLLQNGARDAITYFKSYTENLDSCKSNDMLYTLQLAAIKANNNKLKKNIEKYLKTNKIPASETVLEYEAGTLTLEDIFLSGESELS